MDYNHTVIVGRVTAKPELRNTQGGQSVTSFGVATNRMWTDKEGQRQEQTEFHNIVAFGRTAEIAAEFLFKGSTVLISGRLQTRKWQDKQGQDRQTTEIVCEQLQLGQRPQDRPVGDARGKVDSVQKSPMHVRPEDIEDVPVINLDEEIKAEDIPF